MRRKSVAKRKPAPSESAPSPSSIPNLSDHHNATLYDTDSDDVDGIAHSPGPEPELEPVDLLDRSICICCNSKREEENVLVCSERGCPVTVHAHCFVSEPKFDASGNFYCPYCWYKRAVDTCRQLRDKALIAKQALIAFLDKRPDSDAAPRQEHENPVQDSVEPVQDSAEPVRDSVRPVPDSVTPVQKSVDPVHDYVDPVQDTVKPVQDFVDPVQDRTNVSGAGGLEREEGSEGRSVDEKESEGNKDERKVSATGSSVSETNDSDKETISARRRKDPNKVGSNGKSKLPEAPKRFSPRGKKARAMDEEVTSSETSKQPRGRPVQGMRVTKKRRRVMWTAEEENVLKEGVSKFSTANQNIPWRKILDFGCNVFDNTRTPVDLKDKWKNMISKQGCK